MLENGLCAWALRVVGEIDFGKGELGESKNMPLPITPRETMNIYKWTRIDDPSKIIVYFAEGVAGAPDQRTYFGTFGLTMKSFLEVAPAKRNERYARKRYWVELLGAKKYP